MAGWHSGGGERPAEETLREAFRRADQETDAVAKGRLALAAVTDFLDRAGDDAARGSLPLLRSGVGVAAPVLPDEAVRTLCRIVGRHGPQSEGTEAVLRAWVRRPDPDGFAVTWAAAAGAFSAGGARDNDWYRLLDQVLRRTERGGVSPVFRRLALARLVETVDARFDQLALSASPVWQVLYFLGPGTRADWFGVLGDHAVAKGNEEGAVRRYQLALDKGCEQARPRLARLLAIDGFRRLAGGDAGGAERQCDAAIGLADDAGYRAVRIAATLARGRPATQVLAELGKRRERTFSAPLVFMRAWAQLRARRPEDAAETLRDLLGTAPPDGSDLLANARVLLGLLTADDDLVADGARTLLDRHGGKWAGRCAVGAGPVLAAVCRRDATLFSALDSRPEPESGELSDGAARRAVAEATQAALAGQVDRARGLLDLARRFDRDARRSELIDRLAGQLDRLGEIPDQLATAALRRGEVTCPWADRAELIWTAAESGSADPARLHHLAVAHHAHAYDLELAGDPAALPHWDKAIGYWVRLQADDAWWERMRAHLTEVLTDATPSDVDGAITGVRAELVQHLLAPNQVLAAQLREQDPPRARRHMALVRAAMPARSKVHRQPALHAIAQSVDDRRFDSALRHLEPLLTIDPTNADMVMLAVEIGRRWSEHTYRGDDWAAWNSRAGRILGRIRRLVNPACQSLGLTPRSTGKATAGEELDDLVQELAMYEFWWGYHQWLRSVTNLEARRFDALVESLQETVAHCRLAKRLSENRWEHGMYGQVDSVVNQALELEAQCEQLERDPVWQPYRFGFR
ncbi:MAG TPA: hypothetical protein VFV67_10550 [Actinophytocola sp.]|uniref:hypothetical protein n=1 Tax=Actinophytocola sp. TaxID=1872138 RepID=UPI002DBEC17E|nr:hypothetical protein [Actinophytocola sp.]HEU5471083.1 hypothetical protein [Actinophytocola sp.]